MTTTDITPRQQEAYDFIAKQIRDRGYGPTVREIGDEMGIGSPNGVAAHLKALEKKGLISHEPNLSRSIRLTVPKGAKSCPCCGQKIEGK